MSLALATVIAAGSVVSWFDASSRALTRADSASPEAPASFVSYGPHAEAGIGLDTGVLEVDAESHDFRLGLTALAAFANAKNGPRLPGDVARTQFELSAAWNLERLAHAAWGERGLLELGLGVGRRWAFATEGYWSQDPFEPDAVPFGAGGWYLGIDVGARRALAPSWSLASRLTLRGFTNAWPALFGAHEAADLTSSALNEGARWQAAFEVGTRWHWRHRFEPFIWLYADVIEPPDDMAKTLWLARLQGGGAVAAGAWEWAPFGAIEAGHGAGLLVNRTELRFSLGMRLYAR